MAGLEIKIADGIATLTINNPPQNRLSNELMAGFMDVVRRVNEDRDIRVLLVRADGPNFSFGGDISRWLELGPGEMHDQLAAAIQLFNAFEQLPVPVVAAVQGRCLGGGFELVLRADVIIASEKAVFGHPEQSLGIVTLLGGVQRVAERAGRTRAMRWALTSEHVSAAEMHAAGVITEIALDGYLDDVANTWVARLAKGPTRAHAGHKKMLGAWATGGIEAADELLPAMAEELIQTTDARRGIASAQDALRRGVERPVLKFDGK